MRTCSENNSATTAGAIAKADRRYHMLSESQFDHMQNPFKIFCNTESESTRSLIQHLLWRTHCAFLLESDPHNSSSEGRVRAVVAAKPCSAASLLVVLWSHHWVLFPFAKPCSRNRPLAMDLVWLNVFAERNMKTVDSVDGAVGVAAAESHYVTASCASGLSPIQYAEGASQGLPEI